MKETQLAQIAQQVNHLSRTQGHLLGQPEANPKGHMNAITLRSEKQLDEQKGPHGDKDGQRKEQRNIGRKGRFGPRK